MPLEDLTKVCDLSANYALFTLAEVPVVATREGLTVIGIASRMDHLPAGRALAKLWRPAVVQWLDENPGADVTKRQAATMAATAWAAAA